MTIDEAVFCFFVAIINSISMHGVKRQKYDADLRQRKLARDTTKIKSYRLITDTVLSNRDQSDYSDAAFKLTAVLLDLNPEFYTVWNYRREILVNNLLKDKSLLEISEILTGDLNFTTLQLRKVPKCYWVWTHRTWCLENNPLADLDRELKLVDMFLSKDARNYHSWRYRRYVIAQLEARTNVDLTIQEFHFTTEMINKNFSNYSALHNRTKLIEKLFANPGLLSGKSSNGNNQPTDKLKSQFRSKLDFLKQELEYFKNALYTDPEDQSIWLYVNWLLTSDFFGDIPQADIIAVLRNQMADIRELNELEKEDNGGIDNKWCLKIILSIELVLYRLSVKQDVKDTLRQDILKSTTLLQQADPKRKNRYIDICTEFEKTL